jgi:hypothetical protein
MNKEAQEIRNIILRGIQKQNAMQKQADLDPYTLRALYGAGIGGLGGAGLGGLINYLRGGSGLTGAGIGGLLGAGAGGLGGYYTGKEPQFRTDDVHIRDPDLNPDTVTPETDLDAPPAAGTDTTTTQTDLAGDPTNGRAKDEAAASPGIWETGVGRLKGIASDFENAMKEYERTRTLTKDEFWSIILYGDEGDQSKEDKIDTRKKLFNSGRLTPEQEEIFLFNCNRDGTYTIP